MRRGRVPFERSCAVCRRKDHRSAFVRLALSSAGGLAVDPTGRAQGRGIYLCRSPRCVERAFSGKGPFRRFRERADLGALAGEVGLALAMPVPEAAARAMAGRRGHA